MAQAIPTTSQVTSIKGKVHTNEPINPLSIVRIEKEESRWDGREYEGYPCILIEIEDEGKQKWFYAKGDEATRDADYTALDAMINNLGGDSSPILYDAVVDASGGGDYLLPSLAIAGGACSIFVRAGSYTEVADIDLGNFCSIVGETSGTIIEFPAGFGITSNGGGTKTVAGNISITSGTNSVVGVGTSFTGRVGEYIRIGQQFYKIGSVTDSLNLTLEKTYKGKTIATSTDFSIRPYVVGVNIENLNLQGGRVSNSLIDFDGVLFSTIKKVSLSGSGVASSNIGLSDVGISDIENVLSDNSDLNGLSISNGTGIKITESNFYNNDNAGIDFFNSRGLTFDTCFINHNSGDGINGSSSSEIVISDCQSHNNNDRGIHVDNSVDNVIIDSCSVSGFTTSGITNGSTSAGTVTGCIVAGSGRGITLGVSGHAVANYLSGCVILVSLAGSGNGKILSNHILGGTGEAIRVEGPGMIVSNNTIDGATLSGVRTALSATKTLISNNSFNNIAAPQTAIIVATSDCKVEGNIFESVVNEITIVPATDRNACIDGIIYNTLATIDATPTTIATIPLPTNGREYSFKVYVGAERNTGTMFGTWHRTLVVNKSVGGVPTIQLFNADVDVQTGLIPTSVTAVVNGGDIDIQVTGNAGQTYNWTCGHVFLNQSKFFI